MSEETRNQSLPTPFIVFVSIVGSVVVVGALLYILREPIIAYVFRAIEDEVLTMMPEATEFKSDDQLIRAAIAEVNPAVVSVIVTKDVPVYERYYETLDPWGWFGGITIPRLRENGTEEREVGGGSGFIVSHEGLIVTNRHVVADESARYSVVLNDGTVYPVEVVARDTQLDIAILNIDEPLEAQLPVVRFGDSRSLELGQTVIAIGNALAEFQNSVSVGVISGVSRSIVASDTAGNTERLNQVIQTDAAINPGNSGGPLISITGEVVGVNVATSQGADNIGFALPAELVEQVVLSVKETGRIVRPYLGVRYQMLTEAVARERELDITYGALLIGDETAETTAVETDSPAAAAGLTAGDVIVSIDGEELRNKDLATVLRGKRPDDVVKLEVWRAGEVLTINVTLATLES